MTELLKRICTNHELRLVDSIPVQGGDINKAYRVATNQGLLFVKLNLAEQYPDMFLREAKGLDALRISNCLKVPTVYAFGRIDAYQYLLLEWLQQEAATFFSWTQFGSALAGLHRVTAPTFGWNTDNFIGSLEQINATTTTWARFYGSQRLMPLATELTNRKMFSAADLAATEALCIHLDEVFPEEPPALLHGDLWHGNYMFVRGSNTSNSIETALYDPAVYFGHREMDMAMTKLFGGFSDAFYNAYQEAYPLERNWHQRVPMAQLYPLLVHALLFGGSYVARCRSIIRQWS